MSKLKTILLVEDNPNDRELTLTALEAHNLVNEVIALSDGEQALDYLYKRGKYAERHFDNPAVILLDIKMPKVDGIEVLRSIKSDISMKNIPVVMLTSSREEKDLRTAYELGANAYVVKPVEFTEFIEAVKNVGLFWGIINEISG